MIYNLLVWVFAAYLLGVVAMAVGLLYRNRTDPWMWWYRADDPGFHKAVCVVLVVLWPGVPLALPLLRRFNLWLDRS